jgi:hypothetical protein
MTELKKATTAKYKKPQPLRGTIHRFPRAMLEIAKVSQFGAEKHEVPMGDMGYLHVPDADVVYGEAEMRHILALPIEGAVNHGDGDLFHKAQKAWNALADLEVFLYRREIGSSLVEPDFQPITLQDIADMGARKTTEALIHKHGIGIVFPGRDEPATDEWFYYGRDRRLYGPFNSHVGASIHRDHGNAVGGTD